MKPTFSATLVSPDSLFLSDIMSVISAYDMKDTKRRYTKKALCLTPCRFLTFYSSLSYLHKTGPPYNRRLFSCCKQRLFSLYKQKYFIIQRNNTNSRSRCDVRDIFLLHFRWEYFRSIRINTLQGRSVLCLPYPILYCSEDFFATHCWR